MYPLTENTYLLLHCHRKKKVMNLNTFSKVPFKVDNLYIMFQPNAMPRY